MSKTVTVLGAGLVGAPLAIDLAMDPRLHVTVADRDQAALARLSTRAPVFTAVRDLSDPAVLEELVDGAELVVEALPGRMGFRTLRTVIERGVNVVSISFFPENPFELDDLARANDVTAVVDCGVFPGMGSALIMDAVEHRLDRTDRVSILIGGLPENPRPPLNYRAVYSPSDVIEEYVRPARHVENGEVVVRPALSDVEPVRFEDYGDLEAFSTDGLRTLLDTIHCPNIREKTLRLPGTAAQMNLLRDIGLFGDGLVPAGGAVIQPRDMALSLLGPMWEMPEGEGDVTLARIEIAGERDGAPLTVRWELEDHWDRETGVTSMARTTGYTATAAARMVLDGAYREPGISPPEYLGRKPAHVERMLAELAERGVIYRKTDEA